MSSHVPVIQISAPKLETDPELNLSHVFKKKPAPDSTRRTTDDAEVGDLSTY